MWKESVCYAFKNGWSRTFFSASRGNKKEAINEDTRGHKTDQQMIGEAVRDMDLTKQTWRQ